MKGRVATLLRSFLGQGAFNYERMSGVGFAFIMRPLLGNLPPDRRDAARRRSAEYFNSHPYLSGLAATALVKAELDGATDDELTRFKKALIGSLGLVGDRFIWAGLLPAVSAAALIFVAAGAGIAAIVGFLVIFNVLHVGIRWAAIQLGSRRGLRVGRTLVDPRLRRTMTGVDAFAAFMIGVAVPLVGAWMTVGWQPPAVGGIVAVALVGAILSRGFFQRFDSRRFGMGAITLAILLETIASWL